MVDLACVSVSATSFLFNLDISASYHAIESFLGSAAAFAADAFSAVIFEFRNSVVDSLNSWRCWAICCEVA